MKELIDLEATNGQCIAELDIPRRIWLLCIEELGDEYVRTKNLACVWIPTDTKAFWKVIKIICEKNAETEKDGAKIQLRNISEDINCLLQHLDDER